MSINRGCRINYGRPYSGNIVPSVQTMGQIFLDSLLNDKCKVQHTEQCAQYDPISVNPHTNRRNTDRYTQLTSVAPVGWNRVGTKGNFCLYCTHFLNKKNVFLYCLKINLKKGKKNVVN